MMRRALAALLFAALAVGGCGPSPQEIAQDRADIRKVLEAYLPHLADAYATGNTQQLQGMAVEKEIAHVDQMVGDLAQQGQSLHPTLKQLTIEDATFWSHDNAYVTTLEIWDIRSFVVGTDHQLNELLNHSHRVKYQLKRRSGRWEILYRQVEQTF
jgi:ARC6-like, IMS domain